MNKQSIFIGDKVKFSGGPYVWLTKPAAKKGYTQRCDGAEKGLLPRVSRHSGRQVKGMD